MVMAKLNERCSASQGNLHHWRYRNSPLLSAADKEHAMLHRARVWPEPPTVSCFLGLNFLRSNVVDVNAIHNYLIFFRLPLYLNLTSVWREPLVLLS